MATELAAELGDLKRLQCKQKEHHSQIRHGADLGRFPREGDPRVDVKQQLYTSELKLYNLA